MFWSLIGYSTPCAGIASLKNTGHHENRLMQPATLRPTLRPTLFLTPRHKHTISSIYTDSSGLFTTMRNMFLLHPARTRGYLFLPDAECVWNGMESDVRLTKNDMSRVIIQALYKYQELPPADNCRVVRMARNSKSFIEHEYHIAHKILTRMVLPTFYTES